MLDNENTDFIVLDVEAWSYGDNSGTEYRWNRKRYKTESLARNKETDLRGHDDFVVVEVSGDIILAVCTGTDGKRIDCEELKKIAEHINLRY
jgi:hypothetical protein